MNALGGMDTSKSITRLAKSVRVSPCVLHDYFMERLGLLALYDANMKTSFFTAAVCVLVAPFAFCEAAPDTTGPGWSDLFGKDYSDAVKPDGVWTIADGAISANKDEAMWTKNEHSDFMLDLEFKNSEGSNSGVLIYCSDKTKWIPNSVEVQIADDFFPKWANSTPDCHAGAIYGHVPTSGRLVKKPGEWNKMTIEARGKNIKVWLNGTLSSEMDMAKWTSAKTNPDGTPIPPWLSNPLAEMPTKGFIGFQGKHGDSPITFRNIRIKSLAK
jgi:hypothetical protein